jgi:hypothetical protein
VNPAAACGAIWNIKRHPPHRAPRVILQLKTKGKRLPNIHVVLVKVDTPVETGVQRIFKDLR